MVNPDGVRGGNYRTNLRGQELEQGWIYDEENPQELTLEAPLENRLIHEKMREFLQPVDGSPAVSMVLNLHSSNEEPEVAAYLVPHFGSDPGEYDEEEREMWHNQIDFIDHVSYFYNERIEKPPPEGGSDFLKYFYPERWWWENEKEVIAMTLETTYGKAGYDHWVTDTDIKDLGKSLAYAIDCYYLETCSLPRKVRYNESGQSEIYTIENRLSH
ncbi:MAG: hypothetical protein V3V61_05390, partial [Gammaproteobacteria bacterium]